MTVALTFPDQGSQQVGMGKALYDAFAESRAVFEEVDDALGEKLSTTIFEGPEDTLTLTANAQPALMAVSLAVCVNHSAPKCLPCWKLLWPIKLVYRDAKTPAVMPPVPAPWT